MPPMDLVKIQKETVEIISSIKGDFSILINSDNCLPSIKYELMIGN